MADLPDVAIGKAEKPKADGQRKREGEGEQEALPVGAGFLIFLRQLEDHLFVARRFAAREQLPDAQAERFGQRQQKRNLGQAPPAFPFGNGLVCHAQPVAQLALGKAELLSFGRDQAADLRGIHENTFLSSSLYPIPAQKATYAP